MADDDPHTPDRRQPRRTHDRGRMSEKRRLAWPHRSTLARRDGKQPDQYLAGLRCKRRAEVFEAMVGATGFEPATSCSRSRRATGLRYAPPNIVLTTARLVDAPVGIRTPNLLIRSQMLYPVELRALTTRRTAVAGDRMQTRKIDRVQGSVNPTDHARHGETHTCTPKKNPRRTAGGNPMGGTRLELVTSTMSTWRSNQLS